MARVKLSNELKKAISLLPDKDKDRLLFRLIALKPYLAEQLKFKLLEGSETTIERREDVETYIENHLVSGVPHFYSPGYLLLELRHLSGRISSHVQTTKDKYGEVGLNLQLLIRTLELYGDKTKKASTKKATTFNNYMVKRTIKLMGLLSKMHEDHILDFKENMEKLSQLIHTQPTMLVIANELGLELWRLENGEYES